MHRSSETSSSVQATKSDGFSPALSLSFGELDNDACLAEFMIVSKTDKSLPFVMSALTRKVCQLLLI
jgi:hypothetical protein